MRLRARVKTITDGTKHYRAHIEGSEVVKDDEIEPPAWVEIQPADGAFSLLYLDGQGECIADTWHETLDKAKAQANFEFALTDADWEQVES
jgi:hypothetical protein